MTVAFSTASQPINITLGLPSQRGGADGDGEGGGGTEMRFRCLHSGQAAHRSNTTKKLSCSAKKDIKKKNVRTERCTHTYARSQPDKYLLLDLNSPSLPRRKLLPSNKHIYPINSDSTHWPVTGTKLNVNTPLRLFHHAVDCRRAHR